MQTSVVGVCPARRVLRIATCASRPARSLASLFLKHEGPHTTRIPAALATRSVRLSAGIARALATLLCAAVAQACLASTPAAATPALSWSTARIPGAGALTGVSCPSTALCVAVDAAGDALISTNPTAGAGASWRRVEIDPGRALTGVSCASSALCVAVDGEGHASIGTDPGAGASWSTATIPGAAALTGVSCASTTLCVAVDKAGDALLSTNSTAATGASWSRVEIDSGKALTGVSCASATLCVAVDGSGQALTSSEPAGAWHPRPIDLSLSLVAVSCAAAPAGLCVAVDGEGAALASGNPFEEKPTWSWTPAFISAPGRPTGVSCAAAGLCVSVDNGGGANTGDNPTATAPSWTFYGIDPSHKLSGVSCVSEGLCAAVDNAGQVLITRVPPPALAGGAASAIAETSATLAATVNPNDATLVECRFEYGPSEAYGQSANCATPLPAGGAAQAVSAALSGLEANTTYHYRLVARSASGVERTLDATFKTSSPPLVQPHPSIGGIPARGQRLTCKPGVSGSASAGATLAFSWLRDTRAIAGANGSTYLVSSADVSHHLQCRVSATNAAGSASATSAFVTVPAGGLGSISETQVGAPRVSGRTVSVPLRCSAQAAGSCTIALRLTVVETLRGTRVIAVAARRTRRLTVTVGASTVHLSPGQQRTVTVALNATGRRLLAHVRRMGVKLSVSGTVVGALSAPLKSVTLTLGGARKASSRKTSSGGASARKTSSRTRR
ncbi:MAG: hypothetical protein ACHQE6_08610 [Solirubrobacterales bacterium]